MHIVSAFEAAQAQTAKVNKQIQELMMKAVQDGDVELADKLNSLTTEVSGIIKPFTE